MRDARFPRWAARSGLPLSSLASTSTTTRGWGVLLRASSSSALRAAKTA